MTEPMRRFEFEAQSEGMYIGLSKARCVCRCGWSSDWKRSQHHSLVDWWQHAGDCDEVLEELTEPEEGEDG